MSDILGSIAVHTARQGHAAQWTVQAGAAFALEKRKIDGEHALKHIEGHARTELVNALRSIGQQLRP